MSNSSEHLEVFNRLMITAEMANAQAMSANRASQLKLSGNLDALLMPSIADLEKTAERAEKSTNTLSQQLDALLLPSHKELEMLMQNIEEKSAQHYNSRSQKMFAQLDLAEAAVAQSANQYAVTSPEAPAVKGGLFAHKKAATPELTTAEAEQQIAPTPTAAAAA